MRIAILAVVLLSLAGCRETIVAPISPVDEPTTGSSASVIAVKGPRGDVPRGYTAQLRAQPTTGVVSFEWVFQGSGEVLLRGSSTARILDITADRPGAVTAAVRGLDENGRGVGYGEIHFEIVP